VLDGFGANRVGFGGMVRRLQCLHRFPQVSGSAIPLCEGPLFAGGKLADATALVKANPEVASFFHFFVGCCTWDSDELAQEIETGYWLPIQTHADRVLALSLMDSRQQDTAKSGGGGGNRTKRTVQRADGMSSGDVDGGNPRHEAGTASVSAVGAGVGMGVGSIETRDDSGLDAVIEGMATGEGMLGFGPSAGQPDLWSLLLGRLGNAYSPALSLAPWIDASSVESLDSP